MNISTSCTLVLCLFSAGAIYPSIALFIGKKLGSKSQPKEQCRIPYAVILSIVFIYLMLLLLHELLFGEVSQNQNICKHFLLSMTQSQSMILIIPLCIDSFEIGMYTQKIRFASVNDLHYHHTLSIIGIVYQLHYKIGGGLMNILLLDSITYLIALIEYLGKMYGKLTVKIPFLNIFIYDLIQKTHLIAHWISRIFLYLGASLYTFWVIGNHLYFGCDVDLIWSFSIFIWSVGANYDNVRCLVVKVVFVICAVVLVCALELNETTKMEHNNGDALHSKSESAPPKELEKVENIPPNSSRERDNLTDIADSGSSDIIPPIKFLGPVIAHIMVVGFHHAYGHRAEFVYPPLPIPTRIVEKTDDAKHGRSPSKIPVDTVPLPDEWDHLPFLAMPDGAHLEDEDYTFFNLPGLSDNELKDDSQNTLFGVSCYRQISPEKLQNITADIKRSRVQKAVVAIARLPIYGAILTRLSPITHAYFEQGDFSQTEILKNIFDALNNSLSSLQKELDDSYLYVGLKVRALASTFGRNLLVIFKSMLLEQKVVLYSPHPVNEACVQVLSLVSLMPGLLEQHCFHPELISPISREKYEARISFGFPFEIFNNRAFLHPYFSVHQLELMKEDIGILAGTSNALFIRPHPYAGNAVICDISTGEVQILGNELNKLLNLTSADSRFIDNICKVVEKTKNRMDWDGSDDWIRTKFAEYLEAFTSSLTSIKDIFNEKIEVELIDLTNVNDFNQEYVRKWLKTHSFRQWISTVTPNLYEDVSIHHPSGPANSPASLLSDIGNSVAHRLNEIEMASVKAKVDNALDGASSRFQKFVADISARSRENKEKEREKEVSNNPEGEQKKPTISMKFSVLGNAISNTFSGVVNKIKTNPNKTNEVSTNGNTVDIQKTVDSPSSVSEPPAVPPEKLNLEEKNS